ncbi:hypothetical protein AR158_C067R [Paramecium bursaria Chlorella virus AR158]|uniref:hypothetical protein n=1 Tax=Paramecium bursaria Chlorella virus AR158 TaxID=380598 RepID=UPI00015AA776|nr:hypothetical protein AR158_C067R [Paramecium bursaria Chlorella virus AR158]ABU43613.1 hypothetical protein AR158_C067R [Paramecium bursaria Chlorella virus AR158]
MNMYHIYAIKITLFPFRYIVRACSVFLNQCSYNFNELNMFPCHKYCFIFANVQIIRYFMYLCDSVFNVHRHTEGCQLLPDLCPFISICIRLCHLFISSQRIQNHEVR